MFAAHYKNLVTIQLRLIGGVLPNEIKTMKSNFSNMLYKQEVCFNPQDLLIIYAGKL